MEREYIVTADEMKCYDKNTIEHFGIPSLVLMERAALAIVEELRQRVPSGKRVLVAAGTGNNGGDGLAVARLLLQCGYQVAVALIGEKACLSKETGQQLTILLKYGCLVQSKIENREYDIVIDAIFGIGLDRATVGCQAEAIRAINELKAFVCAIDIPSGVSADTGAVQGTAVRADMTVTFAFLKRGHLFYPGRGLAGDVVVKQIGITKDSFLSRKPGAFTYCGNAGLFLPKREAAGHKGTFGKVLVIAGSETTGGCCVLCAEAAIRAGAGMVQVLTAADNKQLLLSRLPEALVTVYSKPNLGCREMSAMDWADCIVIGPGIGTDDFAKQLLAEVLARTKQPLLIDADGLSLLSANEPLRKAAKKRGMEGAPALLTPHAGEFVRLSGCSMDMLKENLVKHTKQLANSLCCAVVCKDACSVLAGWGKASCYINSSGNDGMATAGSGDVLTGMIGGLLAQGMPVFEAAALGVYLHGLAGDRAAACYGRYAMTAGDIVLQLKVILNQ